MRICIASGTYHPDVGGPPTYLYALAEDLVRRGHRLKVVTYGQSGGRYPYPIRRVSRDLPTASRLALFGLATIREARGADLLYVNDYGLPPTAANLLLGKPLVLKVVGDFAWEYAVRHALVPREITIDDFQQQRFGRSVERLRRIQGWYARRAHLVITPSHYLASIVAGWGVPRQRLRVIYNAPTPLPPAGPGSRLGAADAANDQAFTLVVVARLAPWKGIDVLIRALAEARRQDPRLRLLVVGDGDERPTLERLAAPLDGAVCFTGQVERPTAVALMQAGQAVVLPSAYEGLSHVLLEAMEAGRPIVASAVGGNRELIRDGDNGLLVPYGDVAALTQALLRLAAEPDLAAGLGARARADAEARAWPKLVEGTLAVFDEALAPHRAATR